MDTYSFKRIIKDLKNLDFSCRGEDAVSQEIRTILRNALTRVEELRQESNPWESITIEGLFKEILDNHENPEMRNKFVFNCEHKSSINVYYESPFVNHNVMWENRTNEIHYHNMNKTLRDSGIRSLYFYAMENIPRVINGEDRYFIKFEIAITPKMKSLRNSIDKGFIQEEIELLIKHISEHF